MTYKARWAETAMALVGTFGLTAPVFALQTDNADAELVGGEAQSADNEAQDIGAIVVTARRRSERLQDVPDSVSAFSGETLEAAGVSDVRGVVGLTPNVTFRDSFRQGQTYITVRGITTGQQGWAPVTFVVDGVPAGSSDSINTGALIGIERIEVLKGPQSALYGAGAIAGAINVITKAPGDVLEGQLVAGYGKANDAKFIGSLSTPVGENAGMRFDGYYHRSDGLQEDGQGRGLNYDRTFDVRSRFVANLGRATVDLRGHLVDVTAGPVYQELLPVATGVSLIDDFKNSPGIQRGIVGRERRKLSEVSGKIELDLEFATVTSISAYADLRQNLFGTTTWGKPPTFGFCGDVGGAGQPPDCFQRTSDNIRNFSQDLRLASNGGGKLQWMIGGSLLNRRVVNGLIVGAAALDASGKVVDGPAPFLRRYDKNHDRFAGVYAQLSFKPVDALELTAALRYDRNKMDTTQYADPDLTQVVQVLDTNGQLISTQRSSDDAWQPKFQASYRWSPNFMTYATVARGFRTGFFNTGARTLAEATWNYEAGIKSELFDNNLIFNVSAFHIDYSNQQSTTIIPTPPYRASSNIPNTKIRGLELDSTLRLGADVVAGLSIGITDAKVQRDLAIPGSRITHGRFTPRFSSNLYFQWEHGDEASWHYAMRADWRHQSSQYLGLNDTFKVGAKNYVDVRGSIGNGPLTFTAYGKNIFNTRQAEGFEFIGFGYLRYNNNPGTYGVELSYKF